MTRRPAPPKRPSPRARTSAASDEQEINLDDERWSGFRDAFGEREAGVDSDGCSIELLRMPAELTLAEQALIDRIARLIDFDRATVGRARRVVRDESGHRLVVVSERVAGIRLSELLRRAAATSRSPDLGAALHVMRRLLTVAGAIHKSVRIPHLAVGAERVVITPRSEVVVVEAALAAAVEASSSTATMAPKALPVALAGANVGTLGPRVDIARIALVGLSMLLGKPLDPAANIDPLSPEIQEASDVAAIRINEAFANDLRLWIDRAITVDPALSFPSFEEAGAALRALAPARNTGCAVSRRVLRAFVAGLGLVESDAAETRALDADRIAALRERHLSRRRGTVVLPIERDTPIHPSASVDELAEELGLPPRDEALQESPEQLAAHEQAAGRGDGVAAALHKAARDLAARELAAREAAAHGRTTARQQTGREEGAREQAVREQAAREQAAREQAVREQAAREQAAREQAAREQAAREEAAREQAAREQAARVEAERLERERRAHEEAARLERERLAREEAERLERVRIEQERLERERLAREEAERLERERLAREEAERLERERLAREEAERMERERLAREEAERKERERLAREEAERKERERLAREEAERKERERLEQERLAREKAEREQRERLAREELERRERERLARERQERERLEQERLARENAEREEQARIAREVAERERIARELAEREARLRRAREKAEREELERIEREQYDREQAARDEAARQEVAAAFADKGAHGTQDDPGRAEWIRSITTQLGLGGHAEPAAYGAPVSPSSDTRAEAEPEPPPVRDFFANAPAAVEPQPLYEAPAPISAPSRPGVEPAGTVPPPIEEPLAPDDEGESADRIPDDTAFVDSLRQTAARIAVKPPPPPPPAEPAAKIPVRVNVPLPSGDFIKRLAAGIVLIVVAGGLLVGGRTLYSRLTTPGTLRVETTPAGADVLVDGIARGQSPLTLELKPGEHTLEVSRAGVSQAMALTVTAGGQLTQQVDLSKIKPVGKLEITSDPSGARVIVDGTPRGPTPLLLSDLATGRHKVSIESSAGNVTRQVEIKAGATTTLSESIYPGWIAVFAPFELQVYQNKRLIGGTETGQIMLSPGSHKIELVSTRLGYTESRTVEVAPGKTTAVNVKAAEGTVRISAPDGAEIYVDGDRVGTGPSAEARVPIGTREIAVRHADFGERKTTVAVTASAPALVTLP